MTVAAPPRTPARPRPAPITVTPAAERRIAELLAGAPGPVAGVRLSTPRRGCSGLSYAIDYVEAPRPGDEAVPTPAGILYVDGASLLYLIGSVMDWKEDDFSAGFIFTNPNASGTCGCGESFTV
jgi:iron-sulfur cluster assembly protein